jgi:hypothetical protein
LNKCRTVLGRIGPKVTAPRVGGHLGMAHGHSGPCQRLRGAHAPGVVTVPAAGMEARREVAAQRPTGDEVNDISKRGSTGGCRERVRGGGAYRVAEWREGGWRWSGAVAL